MESINKKTKSKQNSPVKESIPEKKEIRNSSKFKTSTSACSKQLSLRDFENIKLLGVGAAGHVYLVKKNDNNRIYAMKVLQKDKLSERAQKKALVERNVLLNLHHPFISTLFFSFQTESKLFILMQYCAGGDLYSLMHRQPGYCFLEHQAKFYVSCVLQALEYLHFNGVVYRDIKPENILIRETGHIVLTDFDLSICSPESVHPRLLKHHHQILKFNHHHEKDIVVAEPEIKLSAGLIGTAEYIAPEIIEGKPYTCIVDWWSFGILIYELLYGITPFKGKDENTTFSNIKKCHLEFTHHPREEEEISHKAKSLIRDLLHHNPKKRIGYEGGASEIKDHSFFRDVKFQLLVHQEPPLKPHLSSSTDTHNFIPVKDDASWKMDETTESLDPATLPEDSVWRLFANIDRGDTDPDDITSYTPANICSSKLSSST